MRSSARLSQPVRAGSVDGRGHVYGANGELLGRPGESYLEIATGWDMDVSSPWRRWLPKTIFMGFSSRVASELYITTDRIVLIREINHWRETSGEVTPLGIPNAVAKQAELKKLKNVGAREFCEVDPKTLRLVSSKRYTRRGSMIDMRLVAKDGHQYAISFWKTDGKDDRMLDLIEAQFRIR